MGRRRGGGASRERGVQTEEKGRAELQLPGGLEGQGQKDLDSQPPQLGPLGGLERARGLLKAIVLVCRIRSESLES